MAMEAKLLVSSSRCLLSCPIPNVCQPWISVPSAGGMETGLQPKRLPTLRAQVGEVQGEPQDRAASMVS